MILDKAGQKRDRHLDATIGDSTLGRYLDDQRGSGGPDNFFAERRTRGCGRHSAAAQVRPFKGKPDRLIRAVEDALYASKIVSYAQGMELLGSASKEFSWNLNFGDIATIWRGGCIIRAKFLNRIKQAYKRDPALHNLLLDRYFTRIIKKAQKNWRVAVVAAIKQGVATPAFSASLAYFDSYRQDRLPANLLQAQRDFFGAHTYERIDKPGVFHTEWMGSGQQPEEKPAEPKAAQHVGE